MTWVHEFSLFTRAGAVGVGPGRGDVRVRGGGREPRVRADAVSAPAGRPAVTYTAAVSRPDDRRDRQEQVSGRPPPPTCPRHAPWTIRRLKLSPRDDATHCLCWHGDASPPSRWRLVSLSYLLTWWLIVSVDAVTYKIVWHSDASSLLTRWRVVPVDTATHPPCYRRDASCVLSAGFIQGAEFNYFIRAPLNVLEFLLNVPECSRILLLLGIFFFRYLFPQVTFPRVLLPARRNGVRRSVG